MTFSLMWGNMNSASKKSRAETESLIQHTTELRSTHKQLIVSDNIMIIIANSVYTIMDKGLTIVTLQLL